jgi:hypothetical protein
MSGEVNSFEFVAWIIIVNFAIYLKTLRFKFVSDDFTAWKNPPVAKNVWHKWWLRFTGQLKKLSPSVHFISGKSILEKSGMPSSIKSNRWYMVFMKTEEFDHLFTLLIHTSICVAIYFAFGANWVSFVAAMLYSTNPMNNQATMWPSGRGYSLPILNLLVSISLPILAPALLFFCTWYTIGFWLPLTLVGSPVWYLLAFVPICWFFHSRKYKKAIDFKHKTEAFKADREMGWHKFVVFFKTYGFYLVRCIFPIRITFYHNFLQSMAGNEMMKRRARSMDRYFWIGASFFLWTVYYASTHWGTSFTWAILGYFFGIFPYCNFVRANQEIAERFAAPANVFLMYALAQVISHSPIVVVAFFTFYATRAWYTINLYKDEYWITEMAVIEDPNAWWAWHCRAMKRFDTQSYREALILWVMAKLISPKEFKLLINIATCLRILGNNKEADEHLRLAEQNIIPGQEDVAYEQIKNHRDGKLPILL